MKPSVLNRIRSQYSIPIVCLREMLSEWLSGVDPYPTWEALAEALESLTVGESRLAKTVREKCILPPTPINLTPSMHIAPPEVSDPLLTQAPMAPDPTYNPATQRPPQHAPLPPYTPVPEMHAIDQYANYLRAYYEGAKLPIYSKWPPTASKKYIHLAIVKKNQISKREADEFTRATLHGNIEDIIRKRGPLKFLQVGIKEDGSHARMILMEGAPGIGKTTFAWKLSRKWSKRKILRRYRLVVLLRLRDKRVREAKTVYDLLYHSDDEVRRDVAKEVSRNNGESVLLLFEGFDELPRKLQTEGSIFLDILYREKLPKATVLITSRPSATKLLRHEFKESIDQHIEILGFTKKNVHAYVQCVIEDQQLHTEFTQYLKCYPHIQSLMYVPLNAVIVTEIYKTTKTDVSQELVPTTLTELYTSLTRGMLLRFLTSHNECGRREWKLTSFSDLPEELHQQFQTICRIAFQGIVEDEFIFDDLPRDFNTLDLMQSVPELYIDKGTVVSHNFFHLTLQEFLAAVHVSKQPVEEQLQYFTQSTPSYIQQQKQRERKQQRQVQPMQPRVTGILPSPSQLQSALKPILKPSTSYRTSTSHESDVAYPSSGLSQPSTSTTEPPTTHVSESETSTVPQQVVPGLHLAKRTPLPLQERPENKPSESSLTTQDQERFEPLQVPMMPCLTSESASFPPLMPKPCIKIPRHVLQVAPSARSLPYALLTSSHFQNVLKYTAGLTKLTNLPTASMKSILLKDRGDKQEIPLCSLHWLFEAQCIQTCSEIIGETNTLTFDHSKSMSPFDYFVLGFALSHNNCAWNIHLSGSPIGDEGLEMMVAGMHYREATFPSSRKSVCLNMIGCEISSAGLTHLKAMPEQVATGISELNLSGNRDISEGVAGLISVQKSLQKLDLRYTSLSPQEAEQLAELLSHSQLHNLECLILSLSLKSPESTSHILTALSHNTTLREINFEGACVSDNNLSLLTSALTTNTTLKKLDLGHCKIDDNVVSGIAIALCYNATLETLDLYSNIFRLRGATALAKMLGTNKTLRELNVWNNPFGEEGTLKLVSSIEHNSTLEKLVIDPKYEELYHKTNKRISFRF